MAPRVEQSYEMHTKSIDRFGKLQSATVPYIVFDAVDEDDALQAVLATAPEALSVGGGMIFLSSITINERCNETTYKVNADYHKNENSATSDNDDDMEISFSTGGGTKHIVQALNYHEEGIKGYTDVCKKRIGWNGKFGKGEEAFTGVDVPTSNVQMTLTVVRKMSALNNKWQRNIAGLTGKVNSGKFRGYERGEVLFNGVSFSGSEKSDEVKVSYNFSIQLNENNVLLGNLADGSPVRANKLGWQYVWAVEDWIKDKLQTVLFRLDTVIEFGDFSKLGL